MDGPSSKLELKVGKGCDADWASTLQFAGNSFLGDQREAPQVVLFKLTNEKY